MEYWAIDKVWHVTKRKENSLEQVGNRTYHWLTITCERCHSLASVLAKEVRFSMVPHEPLCRPFDGPDQDQG